MKNFRVKILFFLVLASLTLATGCSSFNRDWRSAPAETGNISGRWEGIWKSDASEHSDKLRCLLTKISEGKYEARFHAKYKWVLSFRYTALFQGTETNDHFSFRGDADLGKLAGGVYEYKGDVSLTNFFSTYSSKYDHGTFQMNRPNR